MNKNKKTGGTPFESNQDISGLLNSLKEESLRRIAGINEQADRELRSIEEEYNNEIDACKKKIHEETERDIDNEIIKITNRAKIEKKKLQLTIIEEYIREMIEESAVEFTHSIKQEYNDFLIGLICGLLGETEGRHITVGLSKKDMPLETAIREAVKKRGAYTGTIDINEDDTISSGGAVFVDEEKGVSYNNTLERIIYRKYDTIRKNISTILEDYMNRK
ncbi:MAG: hypothetical protein GY754_00580 [bacterium]|nr:hypothetical protein [bacterium]